VSDIFQQLSELTETVVNRNGFGHLPSTTNDKSDTGIDIADLKAADEWKGSNDDALSPLKSAQIDPGVLQASADVVTSGNQVGESSRATHQVTTKLDHLIIPSTADQHQLPYSSSPRPPPSALIQEPERESNEGSYCFQVLKFLRLSADPEGPGCCALLLALVSILLIVSTLPFSLCMCIKVVQEYERSVIFRLGRLRKGGAKGPGIFFIIPCIDTYRKVDLRTVSFDVPPQEPLNPFAGSNHPPKRPWHKAFGGDLV